MKISYYKDLDGVRGLAAIMVMFFHFFQGHPVSGNLVGNVVQKLSVFGQTGVTLFFVLSGFLITRILLETKTKSNYFSVFYLRRSFRIFPLYYMFLIITYWLLPIFFSDHSPSFKLTLPYWLYLQNIFITFKWPSNGPNHFWSLAVEEQFYLVWPLIIYFVNEKYLGRVIYCTVLISIFSRYLLIQNGYGSFNFTLSNTDALVLGALLAKMERDRLIDEKRNRVYWIYLILSFLPTIVLWVATGGKGLDIIQIVKLTLLAVVYFSLLRVVITSKGSVLNKLLQTGPLQYSGKISYGLYVFHPLCFGLLEERIHFQSTFLLIVICFSASYLVASLSFHLFEKPILKLKDRFEY